MAGKPVYRFADIEVDPAQGCLRRQGQEKHPRSKVLQVLLYLLEHRDRLVTKQELIDHLWNSSAVTDDAVFHCVTEIRTLLGDSRDNPQFLRTFPAAGYRFIASVEEVWAGGNGNAPATPGLPPRRRATWAAGLALAAACVALVGGGRPWRGSQPRDTEACWWRFDEGSGSRVWDSSSFGNDGVLQSNPR